MTSKDALRLTDYLEHILEAIRRIDRYTAGVSLSSFGSDEKTQDAIIRNLEIIGEAARNIQRTQPDFAAAHPDVPWNEAYLLRNQVAHGYFKVDLDILWRTISHDLPPLETRITALLNEIRAGD